MGSPKFFSSRHLIVKVFLMQCMILMKTSAAPSPIIKFPGDESPPTDKEVALVRTRACCDLFFEVESFSKLCNCAVSFI